MYLLHCRAGAGETLGGGCVVFVICSVVRGMMVCHVDGRSMCIVCVVSYSWLTLEWFHAVCVWDRYSLIVHIVGKREEWKGWFCFAFAPCSEFIVLLFQWTR